jgi:hypothetical protein
MSVQHTPGPWQVNSNDPLHVCDADGESRGCSPIAFVQVGNDGRWTAKANARLIAAAPELLERLEELLEYSENLRGSGVYNRARAAINKATGA